MDVKKALSLVSQTVAVYRGTLAEHQTLQQALKVLQDLVNPRKEEVKK